MSNAVSYLSISKQPRKAVSFFGVSNFSSYGVRNSDVELFSENRQLTLTLGKKRTELKGTDYASRMRMSLFKYLTDNFEVESSNISEIIHFIFKNKIKPSLIEEYVNAASRYIDTEKTIVQLDSNELNNLSIFLIFIPKKSKDWTAAIDGYESYIHNFLSASSRKADKIEAVIG